MCNCQVGPVMGQLSTLRRPAGCRFLSLCRQGGYLSEYEMYFAYMFSFHRHARSLFLVLGLASVTTLTLTLTSASLTLTGMRCASCACHMSPHGTANTALVRGRLPS